MNFNEAYALSVAMLKANIPVALWGAPGIGKSAIGALLAKEFNLEFIDIRLSQREPIDLAGWATKQGDTFTYLPYEEFPLEDAVPPPGKKGWLIQLDEINQAPRQVLAASYQFILDRKVGKRKLHPNVRIMSAGNLAGSNGLAGALPDALVSRMAHIYMQPEMTDGLYPILGEKIFNFLKVNPKYIYQELSKPNTPYPTLRTWEMVRRYDDAHPGLDMQTRVRDLSTIVGTQAAVAYVTSVQHTINLKALIDASGPFPVDQSQALIDYLSVDPDQLEQAIPRFLGEWHTIAQTTLTKIRSNAADQ